MANAQEYDRVLLKVEMSGSASLTSQEKELLRKMLRETSSRGNRARKIVNG